MLWRHVYALETCVCCGDMVYAVWTWDMSSCGRRICLLVGEEYMAMEDDFLSGAHCSCAKNCAMVVTG